MDARREPHADRLEPGQLVLRRSDERPLRILAHDPGTDRYVLEDGSWLTRGELEDPLRNGRRRDLLRGRGAPLPERDPPEPSAGEPTPAADVDHAGWALVLLVAVIGWGLLVLQLCFWNGPGADLPY